MVFKRDTSCFLFNQSNSDAVLLVSLFAPQHFKISIAHGNF